MFDNRQILGILIMRFKLALVTAVAVAASTGAVFAADLPMMAPAPVVAAPAYDWTGFYAGVNAGYGWGAIANSYNLDPASPTPTAQPDYNVAGALAGAQLGYLSQQGNFVLGIEGRVNWLGVNGNDGGTGGAVDSWNGRFEGQLLGQLGYAASDSVLPYLTAGISALNYDYNLSNAGASQTVNQTAVGGVLGVGAKVAVSDNVSIFAEYTHGFYGQQGPHFTAQPGLAAQTVNVQPSTNEVRLGVNFKF
jgi:outer membrane immunogenic protein